MILIQISFVTHFYALLLGGEKVPHRNIVFGCNLGVLLFGLCLGSHIMSRHRLDSPRLFHLLTLFLVTLDQIMEVVSDIGLLTRLICDIFSLHELLISLVSILVLMRKLIVAYFSL